MTRSALEVLREDYTRTARAKGLIEKLIINRHALANLMLPVVTIVGIGRILDGWSRGYRTGPQFERIRKAFVESVLNHDYALTQALVMLVALIFVITNDRRFDLCDARSTYSTARESVK